MRRILRRILNVDHLGRLLSSRTEEVTDDEQGTIQEVSTNDLYVCQACRRPLEKLEEIRGVCVVCRRQCCVTCAGACGVCGKTMCSDCMGGFAEKPMSVCDDCLAALEQRLAHHDRTQEEKAAFERLMAVYGAEMKLVEQLTRDKGSILEFIGQIAQLRLARKLSHLERRIAQGDRHGHRLLP
jgi:hypothetical protein